MPENAEYISPDIQNEIIQILADMLREKMVSEIIIDSFNHLLHLVVVSVVSEIDSCRLFFDQVT